MDSKSIVRTAICIVAFLIFSASAQAQKSVHSDGYLADLSPGTTYIMQPLTSYENISPLRSCLENGSPAIFKLSIPKKSYVRIRFELPDKLSSKKHGSLACAFSTASLYWVEQKKNLNPALTQLLYSGNDTAITLQLGISVAYPEDVYNARYASKVRITATERNNKFILRDSAMYIVEKRNHGWGPYPELHIKNVQAGSTYSLSFSRNGEQLLSPIISGKETASAMEYVMDGDALAYVMYEFDLPRTLTNEAGDSISCIFTATSLLCDDENGKRLVNPAFGNRGKIDGEAEIRLVLGITVSIPDSAPPGTYMGYSLLNMYYTGLKYGANDVPLGSPPVGEIYVNVVPKVIPYEFKLSQNYPNPFNPLTTISYELAEETQVSITIFDMLGREVEQIVNEVQPRGIHQALWNATGHESGIYFCRMSANEFSETTKLILLR